MTIKLSGGYAWLPGVQAIKVLGVNGPASYGDLELQLLHEQVFICKGAAQQFLMSSVCLSVRHQSWNSAFLQNSECSRMLQNVTECSRMHAECIQDVQECIQNVPECIQNVQECTQNVPECSRMHAECSRMHAEYSRMHAECSRMHAVCYRMHAECSKMHAVCSS